MIRKLGVLFSILTLACVSFAQTQTNFGSTVITFSGVPSGPCSANQLAVNTTNGNLYSCSGGSWVLLSAGSGASSVGLALPNIFTVTNSPVTTTGTLTGSFNTQTTNLIFASPNGSTGVPTFRALVGADIPAINVAAGGNGGITGTLPTAQFGSQTANFFLAAPNGSAGNPTFRAMVAADLPGVVVNNAANTFTSAGTVNLTSASATGGLVVPIAAGATPTANGVISYDSTANAFKGGVNGTTITFGAAGGSPGGSSGQVQFNNSGSFGGSPALVITAVSPLTAIQTSNNLDVIYAKRNTDTSPTGNFLHFQNNATTSDLFKVDVSGNTTALSLATGSSGTSGSIAISGSSSGTVTIQPQAAAGTYNFNLPTAAGTSGQALLSGGGGATAMTFGTLGVPAGGTGVVTGTSGGILGFTAATTLASSAVLTSGFLIKGGGAGATPGLSLADDGATTANALTYTGTAGVRSPIFTSTGTTAGFVDYPQGTTSSAVAPCNVATSICEQAPTAVTSYLVTKPGTAANGIVTNNVAAAVDTQGFSGDANHSTTVTLSSATSIGSTSLCSTANCPAGTYVINAYIDVTTACTTTGTYFVSLIYTDDAASKTIVLPLTGTGTTLTLGPSAITDSLSLAATTNFAQGQYTLRSTGAASINYSTTAAACGSGGPAAGKMYLSVVPVQ